ncbi:MAG: hypothetical protein K5793_01515 [Nitrosarchaeum sp.]|nr:hypothetical protein [Nitrosarchaeum sp.]
MIPFLLFFLILFPVYAEPIPDYDKPYAPIFTDRPVYTWTDKVKVTILAPSWNTDRHLIDSIGGDSDNPIKISTREHSLEPYRFTETEPNSGIFTAEITLTGFSHDTDGDGKIDTTPRTFGTGPTSGYLEVDRDSAVTISFEFADGVVLSESVPITWNLGSIKFSQDDLLSDKTAQIQVIDQDMNLNPEALDNLLIRVSSDSDVAGLEVDAIETSESSGVFIGDVSFSQNLPSSGSRLHAIPGDSIYAKYTDYTLPKPHSINDNLEITTVGKLDSSIPSAQRIHNSEIFFSDSFGKEVQSFSTNNQVQIVGKITNEHGFKQSFVYLFQVKDKNNLVTSISWIQSEISANQSLDVSQSWLPLHSGEHFVETFAWVSLANPTPLSSPQHKEIFVE